MNCRNLVLLLTLVLIAGCDSGPQIAPVDGVVVMDDKPLEFGTVMFQNVTGGQAAIGTIQSDGTFELSTNSPGDGAIVGTNRVRVTCYSSQSPQASNTPSDSLGKLLIPRQYTIFSSSGIEFDVPSEGLNDIRIELTSRRRR